MLARSVLQPRYGLTPLQSQPSLSKGRCKSRFCDLLRLSAPRFLCLLGTPLALRPVLRPVSRWVSREDQEDLRDLRALEVHNGLPNIELFVAEDPVLAAEIFKEAGLVLVPNAVGGRQCQELLEACREEEG